MPRQQAQLQFAELAETFRNGGYGQSDSLTPVAERMKLTVQKAQGLSRVPVPGAQGVLNNPKLLQAIFSEDAVAKRRNTAAVEVASNTLVSARIVTHRPATVRAFEEVKAEARQLWVQSKSAELAKAERAKAAQERPDKLKEEKPKAYMARADKMKEDKAKAEMAKAERAKADPNRAEKHKRKTTKAHTAKERGGKERGRGGDCRMGGRHVGVRPVAPFVRACRPTPERVAVPDGVGHAQRWRRGVGAGDGRAQAQQDHAALDALLGLGRGEQRVDLHMGGVDMEQRREQVQ